MTSTNGVLSRHELLGLERWERLVWETDVVELTADLHRAHICVQVKLVGHVGAVDDEVVGECERLGPVLVTTGHEVVGSKAKSVVLLVGAVGDGSDLSTESLGPEESKVSAMLLLEHGLEEELGIRLTVHRYRQWRRACLVRSQDEQEESTQ